VEALTMLTAEELLAGSALTYDVEVPPALLSAAGPRPPGKVRMRPLTVRDLQLIVRAAKDKDALTSALMVQTSLVEPRLTLPQVNSLPVGLLQFLLEETNRISGMTNDASQVAAAAEEPMVRAAFLLAQEFGWTPEQVGELTLGQILLHLQLLREQRVAHG
jgi:hypothetical protein